jgi:hypothetical protein
MEKMVWRQVKEDKKYDQVLIFNTSIQVEAIQRMGK